MQIRKFLVFGLTFIILTLVVAWPGINHISPVTAAQGAPAVPNEGATLESPSSMISASPIHGGCYIAAASDCRLHVDPFTINIATGQKLVQFRLVAIQSATGTQTIIYDWRPDQSNPAPASGTSYSPSLVSQDFAATCGKSYIISLQGSDTGNPSLFNLGITREFTCPSSIP